MTRQQTAAAAAEDTDLALVEDPRRLGLVQEESERELVAMALDDASVPQHLARGFTDELLGRLQAEDFDDPLCKRTVEHMAAIRRRGLLPDLLLLEAETRGRADYSITAVSEMTTRLSDPANVARFRYLLSVVEEAAARRLGMAVIRKAAGAFATRGMQPAEAYERTMRALRLASQRHRGGADDTLANVMADYRASIEAWRQTPGTLRGTTTGLRHLDNMTKGMHRGDLWVIGARTSMGKTALMLTVGLAALRAAQSGHQVGIVSLEMTREWLVHRLVSMLSGIPAEYIEAGTLHAWQWERVEDAMAELEQMPLRIIDASGANNRANGGRGKMTPEEIRRHAVAWHQAGELDALMVDYLELIRPPAEMVKQSRDQQVGECAIQMKALATELRVPVLLVAQSNRESEKTATRKPTLANLRYSDETGQVADVVLLPVRWDYYRERGEALPPDINRPQGVTDVQIAKNRNGRSGNVPLYYYGERFHYVDWDDRRGVPVDYNGNELTK